MRYFVLFLLIISAAHAQTMYYGQVLFKDLPMTELQVDAHYYNANNEYVVASTKTLTKEQAMKRSSSAYTGFYFFEPGQIESEKGGKIVFTFGNYPYSLIISSATQTSYRLNTISFDYGSISTAQERDNEINQSIKEAENKEGYIKKLLSLQEQKNGSIAFEEHEILDNFNNDSSFELGLRSSIEKGVTPFDDKEEILNSNLDKDTKDVLITITIIISLILVIFILTLVIKNGISYLSAAIDKVAPAASPKKILKARIKEYISQMESIDEDSTLFDAAQAMLNSEIVFVIGDSYKGIVKMNDYYSLPNHSIKIKDFQYHKEKVILESNKTLSDALKYMLEKHAPTICISESGSVIGKITINEILSSLRVSKQNLGYIPPIRDYLDMSFYFMSKDEKVKKVLEYFSLTENRVIGIKGNDDLLGIISPHELLSGYLKYSSSLAEQSVSSIMLTNPPKIDAEMDILDGAQIMAEKGMLELPVIVNGNIIGILTYENVIRALLNYFEV